MEDEASLCLRDCFVSGILRNGKKLNWKEDVEDGNPEFV